jgi:hypothetical protein
MQTHSDYAKAIEALGLADLYREQERFHRLAERWARIPGGASQVEVANRRIEILEAEIQKRISCYSFALRQK